MSIDSAKLEAPSEDFAISLTNVSVKYRVPKENIRSLKERAIRMIRRKRTEYDEFSALQDFNLTIRQGEFVALIGRNGAGKSTTLKVIARIVKPTTGRVRIKGRVSSIIELGAGFHPELTGRENIFVNGSMLGYSNNAIRAKFDQIVQFAELEHVIDLPLRTYSTGMTARLGFAVASEVEADILIVDEVLSVGDEAFQRKCFARMHEFRNNGITVLFVTHAIDSIRAFCDLAILLDSGRIKCSGSADEVISLYRSL